MCKSVADGGKRCDGYLNEFVNSRIGEPFVVKVEHSMGVSRVVAGELLVTALKSEQEKRPKVPLVRLLPAAGWALEAFRETRNLPERSYVNQLDATFGAIVADNGRTSAMRTYFGITPADPAAVWFKTNDPDEPSGVVLEAKYANRLHDSSKFAPIVAYKKIRLTRFSDINGSDINGSDINSDGAQGAPVTTDGWMLKTVTGEGDPYDDNGSYPDVHVETFTKAKEALAAFTSSTRFTYGLEEESW